MPRNTHGYHKNTKAIAWKYQKYFTIEIPPEREERKDRSSVGRWHLKPFLPIELPARRERQYNTQLMIHLCGLQTI